MSWFGDTLNNLQSQLSNLTSEVLQPTDADQDNANGDAGGEDVIALRRRCMFQSKELATLRNVNAELEAKCHAAEMQLSTLADGYRKAIKVKDEELSALRGGDAQARTDGWEELEDFGNATTLETQVRRLQQRCQELEQQLEKQLQDQSNFHTKQLEKLQRQHEAELLRLRQDFEQTAKSRRKRSVSLEDVESAEAAELLAARLRIEELEGQLKKPVHEECLVPAHQDLLYNKTDNNDSTDAFQKLATVTAELDHLREVNQSLESSLMELDAQHEEEMAPLIAVKENLAKENKELKSEVQRLKKQLSASKAKKNNVDSTSVDVNDLQMEIEKLRRDNQELSVQLDMKKEPTVDSGAFQTEIDRLKHEVETLHNRLDACQEENEMLESELENLRDGSSKTDSKDIVTLKTRLVECENACKTHTNALTAAEAEYSKLQSDYQQALGSLSENKRFIEELQSKLATQRVSESEESTGRLKDLEAVEAQLSEKSSLLAARERELETAFSVKEQLQQQLDELYEENNELSGVVDRLKNELDTANEALNVRAVQHTDDYVQDIQAEKERLKTEDERLLAEMSEGLLKLSSFEEQLETSRIDAERSTEMLEEVDSFKEELNEMKHKLETAENNCAGFQKELKVSIQRCETLQHDLTQSENKVEELQTVISELRAENEALAAARIIAEQDVEKLQNKLNFSVKEYESLHQAVDSSQHSDMEKMQQLSDELELTRTKLSDSNSALERLSSELDQLRDLLSKSNDEIEFLARNLETKDSAIQILEDQLNRFRFELEKQNNCNDDLVAKLKLLEDTIQSLQLSIVEKDKELEHFQNEANVRNQEIGELSKRCKETQQALLQRDTELSNLNLKVGSLMNALDGTDVEEIKSKDENIIRLESELKEARASLLKFDELKTLLQQECEKTNQKDVALAELETQFAEVSSRYAELKAKSSSEDGLSSVQKDCLLSEKDLMIGELSQQLQKRSETLSQREELIGVLQRKLRENADTLASARHASESVQDEECPLVLDEAKSNLELETDSFRSANQRLTVTLQERDYEINTLQEKIKSLTEMLESKLNVDDERSRLLADMAVVEQRAQEFQRERDEALLAIAQRQQENKELHNQLKKLHESEQRLRKEVDRLTSHLLQEEENNTRDALAAQTREAELEEKIRQLEEQLRTSSSNVQSASMVAASQAESLQQQLSMVIEQRDQALDQISSLDDQVQQHSASLANLQLVLEHFQKEKDRDLLKAQEILSDERRIFEGKIEALQKTIEEKDQQLAQAAQAREAALRLSNQLDHKDELIADLREQLSRLHIQLRQAHEDVNMVQSTTEGKVDKQIMKSLVLGYLAAPAPRRSEVLRLLARFLDFNEEESKKAGIVLGRQNAAGGSSWLSSWLSSGGSGSAAANESLSAEFVRFLEKESLPRQEMRLPAEAMAADAARTRSRTSSTQSEAGSSTSDSHHLVLQPMTNILPTFAAPSYEATANNEAFLRDSLGEK